MVVRRLHPRCRHRLGVLRLRFTPIVVVFRYLPSAVTCTRPCEGLVEVAVGGREAHKTRLRHSGRDGLNRRASSCAPSRGQRGTTSTVRRRDEDEQRDNNDETGRRCDHDDGQSDWKLVISCCNITMYVLTSSRTFARTVSSELIGLRF